MRVGVGRVSRPGTFGPLVPRQLAGCSNCPPGEVSPRVLKTVLTLLNFAGFVESRSDDIGRRLTYYRSTSRMARFTDRWLGYAASTLHVLQPKTERTRLLREDLSFQSGSSYPGP